MRCKGDETHHLDLLHMERVVKERQPLFGPSMCSCIDAAMLPTGRGLPDRTRDAGGSCLASQASPRPQEGKEDHSED